MAAIIKSDGKSYQPTALETLAAEKTDQEFLRNQRYWDPDHNRQRKLFMMVLGSPDPDKPDVKGRSNIKTGLSFLIHELIYTMAKNALLGSDSTVRIEPSRHRGIIFGRDQMEKDLDELLRDANKPFYGPICDGLFDMISHGTTVGRPYFDNDVRTVWDGQKEYSVIHNHSAALCTHPSWDTYPTAGIRSAKQMHEVVFLESVYPHELREWEEKGWVSGVDEFLKDYKAPGYSYSDKGQPQIKNPRPKIFDLYTDSSGRIDLLIRWGLFPLYKFDEYINNAGKDCSADEVETLIIKGRGRRNNILKIDRNFYYHQLKEAIFAKYYDIPGLFWGESIFGIIHRMLVHQEDWVNIIQDSANHEVYRDMNFPKSVDKAQMAQKGPGRVYVLEDNKFKEGLKPEYIERGRAILPDIYNQRDYIDRMVQEVSGIMDLIRGMEGGVAKTAREVDELAQRINVRFEKTATHIQTTYLEPSVAWAMAQMTQFSDDDYVKSELGLPINPYKQFDANIPNRAYRVRLEGVIRAIRNMGMLKQFSALIEQGRNLQPMPDGKGNLVAPNLMEMFFDEFRMAGFKDVDKYKLTIPQAALAPAITGGPVAAGA
jgi:hypothetical protein